MSKMGTKRGEKGHGELKTPSASYNHKLLDQSSSFSEELADRIIADLKEIQSAGPEAVYVAMPCTSKQARKGCQAYFGKSSVKVLDGIDIIGDSGLVVCSVFKVAYPFDGRVGLIVGAAQDVGKVDWKANHGVSADLQARIDKDVAFSLSSARDRSQKIYREGQDRVLKYWKATGLGVLTAVSSVSSGMWLGNNRVASRAQAECEKNQSELVLKEEEVRKAGIRAIKAWNNSITFCEESSNAEIRRREDRAQIEKQARLDSDNAQMLHDARFKNLCNIASFLKDSRWKKGEIEKILSVVTAEDYAILSDRLKRAHDDTRETRDILRLLVDLSRLESIAERQLLFRSDAPMKSSSSDQFFRQILEDGLKEADNSEVQGLYGQAMAQIISGTRSAMSIEELRSLKVIFSEASDWMLRQ
jgi:hypothetical protein